MEKWSKLQPFLDFPLSSATTTSDKTHVGGVLWIFSVIENLNDLSGLVFLLISILYPHVASFQWEKGVTRAWALFRYHLTTGNAC